MNRVTALVFALLSVIGPTVAQDDFSSAALQGDSLYQSGDYAGAVHEYERMITAGVHRGDVYFNLGAAYFQMGDLGRALLSFRRAQALIPRDADLVRNVAMIRARRADLLGEETGLIDSLASATVGIATVDELAVGLLFLWALLFTLAAIMIMLPGRWPAVKIALMVVGVLLSWSLLLLGTRLFADSNRRAAVVVAPVVEVLSGPREDYLPLYRLHSAAEVRVLEEANGWVRFTTPDQRQGWMPRAALEVV